MCLGPAVPAQELGWRRGLVSQPRAQMRAGCAHKALTRDTPTPRYLPPSLHLARRALCFGLCVRITAVKTGVWIYTGSPEATQKVGISETPS